MLAILPPPPKNVRVGVGQPEKVLFQNWKALAQEGKNLR
jgi:hypothetical protein